MENIILFILQDDLQKGKLDFLIFLYLDILHDLSIVGEVAERLKAAVLKTVEGKPSQGSNPCFSAIYVSGKVLNF
jgi:hypothetical protein